MGHTVKLITCKMHSWRTRGECAWSHHLRHSHDPERSISPKVPWALLLPIPQTHAAWSLLCLASFI